jgi:hypothetical protein
MARDVVPLVPVDEYSASEETKTKTELLRWANDIADEVITAALEDAGLHFSDRDLDDEESSSLDLKGEYDPVVDAKTGARLSDAIREAGESLHQPEKVLRRLYLSVLKKRWKDQKKDIPAAPAGKLYGSSFMTTRHGVGKNLCCWGGALRLAAHLPDAD